MKRLLYILFAATLMVGCNNSNNIYIGNPQEITFNAQHISRSALDQNDINNGVGKVYVCGVQNNSSKIFNNVAITRDAATGKWFSATKRNWVEGSNYSFHGYAYNTLDGLTITSGKDGLEFSVQQPTSYDEDAMIDYLLSYSFKVADGAMKPIVQLYLEHAMSLVEVYVVRGNMFDARLTKMTFENIYTQGSMKCTSQAVANSGNKNVWEVSPSGNNDVVYTFEPTATVVIGDKRENTEAHMAIMCLPQQLTANTKLTIEYEVNEKVSAESPDNFVTHKEEFQLYNYQPVNYQSGHRIVYTATVDSGVNLEGVVTEWKDVDYIEGTVLPEIK
ncbi:MAG: fimbrillin family protein [Alistipes sp.]|nr:fimbrillin family protein [Alistipes sp.]